MTSPIHPCPVCAHELYEVPANDCYISELNCGHIFHRSCIQSLSLEDTCPVDKITIRRITHEKIPRSFMLIRLYAIIKQGKQEEGKST